LPFPHEWQSFSTRYVVFGLIVPIICAIVLLWAAQNKQELHRAQLVTKFIMFLGVMYSFVIHQNIMSL
jgi:4-hydroxybenzoate polyprenyltransferase